MGMSDNRTGQRATDEPLVTLLVLGSEGALGYWEPRLRAVYQPRRLKYISHPSQLYGYRGPETMFTVIGETPDRYAEMMAVLDRQGIKYTQAKEPEDARP